MNGRLSFLTRFKSRTSIPNGKNAAEREDDVNISCSICKHCSYPCVDTGFRSSKVVFLMCF